MTSLLKTSPNGNFHFPFILEAEPSIHLPTDQPTTTPSFQKVQLNFTVTNLFYSQDIENRLVAAKGEGDRGGREWEFGISRGKLLYIKWINRRPYYITGNY